MDTDFHCNSQPIVTGENSFERKWIQWGAFTISDQRRREQSLLRSTRHPKLLPILGFDLFGPVRAHLCSFLVLYGGGKGLRKVKIVKVGGKCRSCY